MKPRVFVSSTYYDLKYIRDNVERFITQYGFEAVLFETGNVTFEHETQMDESCYNEVRLCHMMILIIGGRYGSPASGENKQEIVDKYESNYVSITRKEFKTAKEKRIPIFVFIDKNVYAEYQTYKENSQLFYNINEVAATSEQDSLRKFKFAHVDSINVFEFINELKSIPMQSFETFDDIADYLKNQWAGLFYLYLSDIQNNRQRDEIIGSVSELKTISSQIKAMLNEVGKSVLGDSENYQSVIESQNIKIIEYFVEKFFKSISFSTSTANEDILIKTAKILYSDYLENELLSEYFQKNYKRNKFEALNNDLIMLINSKLFDIAIASFDIGKVESINYNIWLTEYFEEILPIINHNKDKYVNTFIDKLSKLLIDEYSLPF